MQVAHEGPEAIEEVEIKAQFDPHDCDAEEQYRGPDLGQMRKTR